MVFRVPSTSVSWPNTESLCWPYAHIFPGSPFTPLLKHLGNGCQNWRWWRPDNWSRFLEHKVVTRCPKSIPCSLHKNTKYSSRLQSCNILQSGHRPRYSCKTKMSWTTDGCFNPICKSYIYVQVVGDFSAWFMIDATYHSDSTRSGLMIMRISSNCWHLRNKEASRQIIPHPRPMMLGPPFLSHMLTLQWNFISLWILLRCSMNYWLNFLHTYSPWKFRRASHSQQFKGLERRCW